MINDNFKKEYGKDELEGNRNIIMFLLISVLCIISLYFLIQLVNNKSISDMQKEYVEPYLEEHYSDLEYKIEYKSSGKCIIDGECTPSIISIDASGCQNTYQYLDNCRSYYYTVIPTNEDDFIVTVVKKGKQKYVVEGKNIYGKDNEEQ